MIASGDDHGGTSRRLPRLPRPTIRLRLTLLYSALFILLGAAMIGVTYVSSATSDLVVNVGSNGQVSISFRHPFSGGTSIVAAPIPRAAASSPADGVVLFIVSSLAINQTDPLLAVGA